MVTAYAKIAENVLLARISWTEKSADGFGLMSVGLETVLSHSQLTIHAEYFPES